MIDTDFTPELFDPTRLAARAGYSNWTRGQKYFQEDRVKLIHVDKSEAMFQVRGTFFYNVTFYLPRDGMDFESECTCPWGRAGYFCKHQVAAALYFEGFLRAQAIPLWKRLLDKALSAPQPKPKTRALAPYVLLFVLKKRYDDWLLEPVTLPAEGFPEETPGKNTPETLAILRETIRKNSALRSQAESVRSFLHPALCVNCEPDLVYLAGVMGQENQQISYYYNQRQANLGEYLELLRVRHAPVYISSNSYNYLQRPAHFMEGEANWSLEMREAGDESMLLNVLLEIDGAPYLIDDTSIETISADPPWLLVNGQDLVRLRDDASLEFAYWLVELHGSEVKADEKAFFLENYLPALAERIPVHHDRIRWSEVKEAPVKRLYLSEEDGELLASLWFGYGDVEFPYDRFDDPIEVVRDDDDPWHFIRVHRDRDFEDEVYRSLSSARTGLRRGGPGFEEDIFRLRARVDPIDFLLRKIPVLLEEGFEIYGEEALKQVRVNRHRPTLSLNITSGIDWFDVQAVVKFGDIPVPLKEVRKALRRKERFVKLADGSIGELPQEWVDKYKHFFSLGEETEEGVRLAEYHLTLLDELLEQVDEAAVDEAFRERVERLKDFRGIESKPLPAGFVGELREYQKAGYDWLHFLHDYGFGGILADDMGLGKTVQVLVFLLSLRESGDAKGADLIIVPRSLLTNWEREAERFTPGLKVYRHFGPGRPKDASIFDEYDLVLTTYGTMRKDIELLREYRFHYAVLDESQAIKNPLSKTAKAARLLNAEHRLAMTGTPVENNAFELWSQFAFVNPGLLGNLEYFKREFAAPIEKDGNEAAAEFLRKLVYPFILRRTKDQVAKELPPRTERILYCDMEPAQRRFYNKTRDQYRAMLLGIVEEQGMNQARMKVLEGLLRLRQISNHPRLVNPKFRGDSAKMELLMQELEMLREGGHKALVFSQFVGMLTLVREELDRRGVPYVYLDGRTRKRQEVVDTFQKDSDIPFFLISLKAGGVGLNLTAADYVIHIDPWWNPAVEMQATDRTHRIGQDKPVFVYKLIARDSVEEKILQLQERKRALVSQLISTESSFFKSLSKEDIETLFS